MSLKLNNLNIEGMKFGGHKVIGGMLNGQNLFTFEGTPYMSFRINTSLTMNNNFTIPFVFDNYGSNLSNTLFILDLHSSRFFAPHRFTFLQSVIALHKGKKFSIHESS